MDQKRNDQIEYTAEALASLMATLAGSVKQHKEWEDRLDVAHENAQIIGPSTLCGFLAKMLPDMSGVALPFTKVKIYMDEYLTSDNFEHLRKIAEAHDLKVQCMFRPILGVHKEVSYITLFVKG